MNNDELTNVNLMTNEKLQKIYDFMKENKEVVHDIYKAINASNQGEVFEHGHELIRSGGIVGPEPGVYLGEGKWRDYNSKEIESMKGIDPVIAQLNKWGLVGLAFFDDEGTGMDHYSANKNLTMLLTDKEILVNDSKIITSFENPLEIYSKLPVNVGNRGENQIREKAIDGIVTELFNYKMQQKTK